MVTLFNERNGASLETAGDTGGIGDERMAAILSGIEYAFQFTGLDPKRIKLVSVKTLPKGEVARVEPRLNGDVVVHVSKSEVVKRSIDEVEQVAFHEIAHLVEDRFASEKTLKKEQDNLVSFRSGGLKDLPQTTASKKLEKALNDAGFDTFYDKKYGKITFTGKGKKIYEELPETARKNADLGGQDSELIAESIRFVALYGYGKNEVADIVAGLFIGR